VTNGSESAISAEAMTYSIPDPRQAAIVSRYLAGALSAHMTLVYCLQSTPDAHALRRQLHATRAQWPSTPSLDASRTRMGSLIALLEENFAGCDRIARMLRSGVDSSEPAASVADGIAFCQGLFDWSVDQSCESSVALYSLGNPQILDAATREIVELLRTWNVLGPARDILEIGCGIGRFQRALAAEVRSVHGIDVSPRMIAVARVRCAGLPNVFVQACSGKDLSMFETGQFDVVLAIDSFAYLVQSGMALVRTHFAESRRILRPGGHFVILEFSYRDNIEADRADVRALAQAHGFDLRVAGSRPFTIWDGAAFHMTLKDDVAGANPKWRR
jgi:predicted TPR repeat methyltransferase